VTWIKATFWLSAICISYTYVAYPLFLALLARIWPARGSGGRSSPLDLPVSVVLAAYNEESRIRARIRELVALVAGRRGGGEVIIVSDGSTDRTGTEAMSESAASARVPVRVFEQESRQGKAVALSWACAQARHPILVFADGRQTWAPDAIDRLTSAFADPAVGGVSGDLVVESAPGVMAGVGLYWRFEKWLRRTESRFDSMVSVTGCIAAARRELFPVIPPGTILDDVYWPLAVTMTGHRVIHEQGAKAFDRLPARTRDEFRRKVRTLAGNFQLMTLLPAALFPWRNRLCWQFVSHRVLRLVSPWALLAMLVSSVALDGEFYRAVLFGQCAFYAIGMAGIWRTVAARSRLASSVASFLVLNAAAWLAFWVWISGRASRSWSKVQYDHPDPAVRQEQTEPRRQVTQKA
jgi:cellulose synthase/poly-beta-1,6-N-acetylglucosamine synthase-like glycosyltransferase